MMSLQGSCGLLLEETTADVGKDESDLQWEMGVGWLFYKEEPVQRTLPGKPGPAWSSTC